MTEAFRGAKLAILVGDRVLAILRDDLDHIAFPDHWDLPGGGREGDEDPETCALRETFEELGLVIDRHRLGWKRRYAETPPDSTPSWFFVLRDDGFDPAAVRFGDEGQAWALMPVAEFVAHPKAVPHIVLRLAEYLRQNGSGGTGGSDPR